MEKQCSRCKSLKPLNDFCPDSIRSFGRQSWCRKCKSERQREIRNTPKGRKRRYLAGKKYSQTVKGHLADRKKDIKYKATHRKEIKARSKIANAVQLGKIPSASGRICAICGEQACDYHHHSYDKAYWFDVIPVCRPCHRTLHPIT